MGDETKPEMGGTENAPEMGGDDQDAKITARIDAAIEKRFAGYTNQIKRLNADLAGTRVRAKETVAEPREPRESKGVTPEDLEAAMQLGELRVRLPEEQRQAIDELAQGVSYAERVRLYRIALITAPKAEVKTEAQAPAIGAPRTSPAPKSNGLARPTTQTEWLKLTSEQRRKLSEDPTFDASDLPF